MLLEMFRQLLSLNFKFSFMLMKESYEIMTFFIFLECYIFFAPNISGVMEKGVKSLSFFFQEEKKQL